MGIKSIIGSSCICLTGISFSASAALISTDWLAAGDNLITYDSVSGFEWLDLTETRNRSYDDVSSKFGAGQEFEGWRYATPDEAQEVLLQFGFPVTSVVAQAFQEDIDRVLSLTSLLGDTVTGSSIQNSYGLLGMAFNGGAKQLGARIEGNLRKTTTITTIAADLGAQDYKGSYLVRATVVPVPAAVWLFGSGLIGLIGVARRKKA